MSIPVVPVTSSIVKVDINIYKVELFTTLSARVYQYNDIGENIKTNDITLTTEEYNSWVDDDALVNLILSKCGLARAPE